MKRSRHVAFTAHRGGEQIRETEEQALPVYDAIAQALRDGDVLRIAHHDFAYETDVLWLLHHLPATSHRNGVEDLLKERFTEQQDSPQCDPDEVLHLKTLAEDIWHAWSEYLQRHDQSAFATARSRAQGLMGRHYYPRTNNH